MKKIICILLTLFITNAFAMNYGVIVSFKKTTSKKQMSKLHKALKTSVEYYSKGMKMAHVVPLKTDANRKQLTTLCNRYEKSKLVSSCAVNSSQNKK